MTILFRGEKIQGIVKISEEQNSNRIKTNKKRAAFVLIPGKEHNKDKVYDRSNKFGQQKVYMGPEINCPKLKLKGIEWTDQPIEIFNQNEETASTRTY